MWTLITLPGSSSSLGAMVGKAEDAEATQEKLLGEGIYMIHLIDDIP